MPQDSPEPDFHGDPCGALGFRLTNTNQRHGYRIVKQIITDPHYACLLVRTRLERDESLLERSRLYALLAPHLEGGGRGWPLLTGERGHYELAAGRDVRP